MKYTIRLLALLALPLALVVAGCENVVPADDLPYVDHIVIRGFLVAGRPIDSIAISHTLPLSAAYDPSKAAIPDAQVTLTVDDRSIPLSYVGSGYFSDPASDTIRSGKRYTIDVNWNGLHARSTTVVPGTPAVTPAPLSWRYDTSFFEYEPGYIDTLIQLEASTDLEVLPHSDDAYGILYDSVRSIDSEGRTSLDEGSYGYIEDLQSGDTASTVQLLQSFGLDPSDTIFYFYDDVAAFDIAYYNFITTYNSEANNGDPFGTGGANPEWNVSGDGIGIFIGEADTLVRFSFHKP